MTNIRSLMTEDHRHCDDLFADVEQSATRGDLATAKALFADFRRSVLLHFDAEEKTLFPTFEAKTGMTMGPTQVMRMEHIQMRALMDACHAALEGSDMDDYLGQAETLLIMMQQHNMKEENVLYPMCDQHLTAELSAVLERLEGELATA